MKHMEGNMVTLTTSWFWFFFKCFKLLSNIFITTSRTCVSSVLRCPQNRRHSSASCFDSLFHLQRKVCWRAAFSIPNQGAWNLLSHRNSQKRDFPHYPTTKYILTSCKKSVFGTKILKFQIPKYQLLITIGTSSIPAGHKGPEPLRKAKTTCEENGLGLFEHQIAITSPYDSRTVIGLIV